MQDFTKIPNLQSAAINVENIEAKKAQFKCPNFFYLFSSIFSSKGRIRRLSFAAWLGAIYVISGLLLGVILYLDKHFPSIIFLLLSGLIFLLGIHLLHSLINKRLQDTNFSGWWGILIIVPPINVFLLLFLFFMPGTKGANKYGDPP